MIAGAIAKKAAAVAAIVTAIVLCVVALGTAAWYGLLIWLQPWAAALVLALAAGLFAGVVALFTFGAPLRRPEPESLTQRVIGLAKERPILATVAGLAAGFIFLRNPALATIVAAALSGAPDPTSRRKH